MKNIKNIVAKLAVATFVFTGAYLINTQNANADDTVAQNGNEISMSETSIGNQIVNYAYNFLGKPYVYGANGPNAFDCSGLTQYVYNNFGADLSRTTYTQVDQGTEVDRSNLQPGDLVFFNTGGPISHVGIYVGDGNFIHAPRTGKPVMISSLSEGYYSSVYAAARRILS